jgi:UDP-glucuronate 4-epimerase
MKVLVTGNAGFIGFHLAKRLLERGDSVVGIDVVNDYYDPQLKEARLRILSEIAKEQGRGYTFFRFNLADKELLKECFEQHQFDRVIHLAAQAGVRYSIENPDAYVESNLIAFTNILECCRRRSVAHLIYASSSSVYGANTKTPFSESDNVDLPVSFYAATKRANELMAYSYSHLYKLPTTGLRFFTVYGPWGRPDMALFKFTRNIIEGSPIALFNKGEHTRDFTYIDDIVEGIISVVDRAVQPTQKSINEFAHNKGNTQPARLFNLGNSQPQKLLDYVAAIEAALGKSAKVDYLPIQPGDMKDTYADCSLAASQLDYVPKVSLQEGVNKFVDWYLNVYKSEVK